MARKHLQITVGGIVQGVFFRQSTQEKAKELQVCGFVRNEPDGNVYIEAEAEESVLDEFVRWCKVGPPAAKVNFTRINEGVLKDFKSFEVRR